MIPSGFQTSTRLLSQIVLLLSSLTRKQFPGLPDDFDAGHLQGKPAPQWARDLLASKLEEYAECARRLRR